MVHKASAYYTQITSTISVVAVRKWTQEITLAESQRLKNPHVMDIIGAREQSGNVELVQGPERNRMLGAGTEWLNLAFSIEERQYVFVSICDTE